MAVRNIRKQLAGVEDLLLGKGKQDQERSAGIVSITKIDIPAIVETIDELSLVDINKYTTAIVKDIDRGGTFIYIASNLAINNGGTIFNGWTRQYSGAANVKWFGAKGDGITDDTLAFSSIDAIGEPYIVPNGTYNITTIFYTIGLSYGSVLFNNVGSIPLYEVSDKKILPKVNTPFIVLDDGNLRPPKNNYFMNPSFLIFPNTDITNLDGYYSSSVAATQQKPVCANWYIKSHSTCTVSGIQKINSIYGGLSGTVVFDSAKDYMYVRQLIPNILRFEKRTYTMSVDIEVDTSVYADFYIQARKNSSDSDRVLVVDTEDILLPVGRNRVACTFTVPALPTFYTDLDWKNSLEAAFRLTDTFKTINFKIYEIIIEEGIEVTAGTKNTLSTAYSDLSQFYEYGAASICGLSTSSGQKRLSTLIKDKKIRQIITSDFLIFDVLGAAGKVSTFDINGQRTDGVTPTAISLTSQRIEVILNGSTAAGISFQYIVNTNY